MQDHDALEDEPVVVVVALALAGRGGETQPHTGSAPHPLSYSTPPGATVNSAQIPSTMARASSR